MKAALAGVAQLIECCPSKWRVAGSISGQGTGLKASPQLGRVREASNHRCFFPSFSLLSPLSKINKTFLKKSLLDF